MKDRFFTYDPGNNDFSTYATEKEAISSAEEIIDKYRDDAEYCWSSDVECVVYGKIIARAKEKTIKPDEPPCGGKVYCADCDKGELAEGIKDEDVCEDYDSENDGEEHADYTLELLEPIVSP